MPFADSNSHLRVMSLRFTRRDTDVESFTGSELSKSFRRFEDSTFRSVAAWISRRSRHRLEDPVSFFLDTGCYDSLLSRGDAIVLQLHAPSMIFILSDRNTLQPLSIVFAFSPLLSAVDEHCVSFAHRRRSLANCCLFAELDNELLKRS